MANRDFLRFRRAGPFPEPEENLNWFTPAGPPMRPPNEPIGPMPIARSLKKANFKSNPKTGPQQFITGEDAKKAPKKAMSKMTVSDL